MITEIIQHRKTIMITGGLVILLCAGSYYAGKGQQKVVTKEKIIEKVVTKEVEKKKENTEKKTKIVEKPDGTKETVIDEKTTSESEASKDTSVSKNTDKSKTIEPVSKYKVGVFANQDNLSLKGLKPDLSANAGVRVLGPIWAEGSYRPKTKTVSLGISLEL